MRSSLAVVVVALLAQACALEPLPASGAPCDADMDPANFINQTFLATGTHKTVLRGSATQQIELRGNGSAFYSLEVTNPAGVLFGTDIVVGEDLDRATSIDATSRRLTVLGAVRVGAAGVLRAGTLTIARETSFGKADAFDVDLLEVVGDGVSLEGDLPHVDVLTRKPLDIDVPVAIAGTLTSAAGGDIVMGGVEVTAGELNVENGALTMTDPNALLEVTGDARFAGVSLENRLTAGTLVVDGDLTQAIAFFEHRTFLASGTHRLILAGTVPQAVSFEAPESHPHHVEIGEGANVTVITDWSASGDCSWTARSMCPTGSRSPWRASARSTAPSTATSRDHDDAARRPAMAAWEGQARSYRFGNTFMKHAFTELS
jgi:hypothetical protein